METSIQPDKLKVVETGIKAVATTAFLFGVYKVYKHFSDKAKSDKAAKGEADAISTNPNAGAAQIIKNAMPTDFISRATGGSFFTNTEELKVIEAFRKIKSMDEFNLIADSYSKLTGGNSLMQDLTKQMQSKYFDVVYNMVKKLNGDIKSETNVIPRDYYIVSTATVNIRKTPKASKVVNTDSLFSKSTATKGNIIYKANPDLVIGRATGKEFYDPEGNTHFVEVRQHFSGNEKDKVGLFYVAKSLVKGVKDFKNVPSKQVKYDYNDYQKAGTDLKGSITDEQIVTTKYAIIYYTDFRPIVQVKPNVLLGIKVMELMGNGKTMIQFKTVDGDLRWVDKNSTKVKN